MRRTLAAVLGIVLLGVVVYMALSVAGSRQGESGEPAGIRIVAPREGEILRPNQHITVVVTSTEGIELAGVVVEMQGAKPFTTLEGDFTAPFEIEMVIPNDVIGEKLITAGGRDSQGNRYETAVNVVVEPAESAEAIVVQPNVLRLPRMGAKEHLRTYALFTTENARDITTASHYTSSNSVVAVVDENGQVTAVGVGVANVQVEYLGLQRMVPVSVGDSEVAGDLDSDLDVDQEDLDLLSRGVGEQSTGLGDSRDLNDDGIINNLDADLLRALCSRPDCRTEETAAASFRRADTNADGKVDISDPIRTFGFLFLGSEAPSCADAMDANDDGRGDISDGIFTLSRLFSGGPPIPPPGPDGCGVDPSDDTLSECAYNSARC